MDDPLRNGWATKAEWTRHRTLIAQLYEDKTLAEVIQIMERQHGFRATSVNEHGQPTSND